MCTDMVRPIMVHYTGIVHRTDSIQRTISVQLSLSVLIQYLAVAYKADAPISYGWGRGICTHKLSLSYANIMPLGA